MEKLEISDFLDEDKNDTDATTSPLPITGAAWQTAVIAGTLDFLLKRAQQEVVYGFVVDLREQFTKARIKFNTSSDSIQLTALFPNFNNFLTDAGELDFKSFIPILKKSIIDDLDNLPFILSKLLVTKISKDTCVRHFLPIFIDRLDEIKHKEDPLLAIAKLADPSLYSSSMGCKQHKEWATVFRSAGILARELYIDKNILSETSLKTFLTKGSHLQIFLTLLYLELNPDVKQINEKYTEEIKKTPTIDFYNFINRLEDVYSRLQELKNEEDSNFAARYSAYVEAFVNTLDIIFTLSPNLPSKESKDFISIFRGITNIQIAVMQKDFNEAIIQLTAFIKGQVLDKKNPDSEGLLKFLRILSFINNMAQIEDSKDVELALSAFADPVGSFRSKRTRISEKEPGTRFAVNAYLGMGFGYEWLQNNALQGLDGNNGMHSGLFLPLGIEWVFDKPKVNKTAKGFSSASLFFSPIDLGNFVNYRLSGNDLDDISLADTTITGAQLSGGGNVGFAQIFTPSLYLTVGLTQKRPISFGLGVQYVPERRKLLQNTLLTDNKLNAFRVSAFIALDLTLFRF